MVDAQTISIVFAGLSIGIAAIYYTLTLRNSQRNQELTRKAQEHAVETRQAQLFMQILNKWNEIEFKRRAREIMRWEWTDYEDFNRKYVEDVDKFTSFTTLGTFLEGVGILVYKGLLPLDLIDNLLSAYIISYWEKYESIEYEMRDRYNVPQSGEFVEYLYKEIKKLVLKQHPELKDKVLTVP